MGKLNLKYENLISALDRLEEAIIDIEKSEELAKPVESIDTERMYRSMRDSLTKRFEFTFELFWKYLKLRLKEIGLPDAIGPRSVIRAAGKANLLSEADTELCLEMYDTRNETSHIYKEEMAEIISSKIPGHYKLMRKYAEKLAPESD